MTTDEDTQGQTSPNCSDIDSSSLTYSIDSQGSDGTASVSGGTLYYDPDPDFNGTDSFTYTANDGELDSDPATVDVTVNAVNDAPTCNGVNLTTEEDPQGAPS